MYSDHPPRADYTLTDRGRDLGLVIGALATWGARHVHPDSKVVNADCGHEVQLRYFCPTCDARVRGTAVTVRTRARAPRADRGAARRSR
jgi:hypothetical protein